MRTLIDQATRLKPMQLERAVNEADKLGPGQSEALADRRSARSRGQTGREAAARSSLDPLTFRLSDSELEQLMSATIAISSGLPDAGNERWVNGSRKST